MSPGAKRSTMRPVAAALVLAGMGFGLAAPVFGEGLAERPDYQAALRALDEQLFQVAALRLERILREGALGRADSAKVGERLVDSLIRSGQPEKALMALTLFEVPDSEYWRAQALVLQGKFRDAESALRAYLAAGTGRHVSRARLTLGQVLIGQGRENTGRKELKELTGSRDPDVARLARLWANESEILSGRASAVLRRLEGGEPEDRPQEFVRASALVELGEGRAAESILRRLMDNPAGGTARLQDATVLRLAEAFAIQGRPQRAERLVQRFIEERPGSSFLGQAFAILDRVRSREEADTVERYRRWAAQLEAPERRLLALFHHARALVALGQSEAALRELEQFCSLAPDHAHGGEAMRLLMALHGAQHNDERVLELAREWRVRHGSGAEDTVDFLTGMIRFSRKEFADAASLFQRSAEAAADVVQKQRALFNMGICALLGAGAEPYAQAIAQLKRNPDADPQASAPRLELDRALHLAARRETGAEEALREFIQNHPADPHWVEAQVALAEFCLLDLPPRTRAARAALEAAAARTDATPEWRERLDYTRIWLREGEEDFRGVCEDGDRFVKAWPKSPRCAEVRMKVAQAYYRLEDFPRARAQFELLVELHPDTAFVETAQFFAGRAAMSTLNTKDLDAALDHFSEVAQRGGMLASEARRQMALIKRLQGREADALAAIETILAGKPAPEGEERLALLVEKGELLALLSKEEPRSMDEAVAVFRSIARQGDAPRYWRVRAGALLAQSLQRLGRDNEAVEACDEALQSAAVAAPAQLTSRELAWVYRAGFLAMEILEAKKQWLAAAKVADRLADTSGSRAQEARERANRIRLEHFIWDK